MGLCIICRERPAELPDRDQVGRPIKRLCRQCHRERLAGDLRLVWHLHQRRVRRDSEKEKARELLDITRQCFADVALERIADALAEARREERERVANYVENECIDPSSVAGIAATIRALEN